MRSVWSGPCGMCGRLLPAAPAPRVGTFISGVSESLKSPAAAIRSGKK